MRTGKRSGCTSYFRYSGWRWDEFNSMEKASVIAKLQSLGFELLVMKNLRSLRLNKENNNEDLSTYFGVNTAVVTPFAYEKHLIPWLLISICSMCNIIQKKHSSYRPDWSVCAGSWGNLAYAQSDWNASKRQEWSNKLFQWNTSAVLTLLLLVTWNNTAAISKPFWCYAGSG